MPKDAVVNLFLVSTELLLSEYITKQKGDIS